MSTIEDALNLRSEGNLNKSNELLRKLTKANPHDASLQYQCAWSFDVLGEERAAVPYYERAIKLGGLSLDELRGAYVGLGSTYRTLGEYTESERVLQEGLKTFPDAADIAVFYAMTLYNLGRNQAAMELLLKLLATTSNEESVQAYAKAITFYADKLDQTWGDASS
ncbi:tetratricopeptide repeat protein [Paenalkalicoccus suaedae]|nr:tetratricopeptide repeat protein [Paenalkalicoccus suaedae]